MTRRGLFMGFRRPADKSLAAQQANIMIFWGFLLLAVLYFFNVILGPYAMVRLHDTFDTDFLHYVIQGKLLLKFGFFGWYPDWAGGMPSFVAMHPPYYPLSLISAFVPLWLTYSLLCVGFMALAGYGMFRMLQVLFRLDQRIALLGGILFTLANWAFSGFVINEVFNYLFPLFVVWSIELCQSRLSTLQKTWRILGLLAISVLSYSVITLPFFPIIHLALVLAYGQPRENLKRLVLQTILIWTGYVLIFLPYIYALYDYIPFAHRNYDCVYNGLFPSINKFCYIFGRIILITPVTPLFICGVPLLRFSRNYRLISVLIFLSAAIYAFFESPLRCVFANTFLMKMDLSHFNLVLIILLTIAASLFIAETLSLKRGRPSILACIIAFAAAMFQPNPFVGISVLAMGLSLLAIIRLGNSSETSVWQDSSSGMLWFTVFVIALAVMGMAAKGTDIGVSQPYARLYNNHPELNLAAQDGSPSAFRVGTVDIHPGVTQSYGLETVGQRGPLFSKYYKQLIKGIILPQLQDPADEKFFDTHWTELYLTTEQSRLVPPDQRPVTDWNIPLLLMMNVKYLVARQPIVGIEPYTDMHQKIDGQGLPVKFLKNTKVDNLFKLPLYLYRFKEPFARGYLATTPVILPNNQEVMQRLAQQSVADLKEKVFFSADAVSNRSWPERPLKMTAIPEDHLNLTEYTPDRLVFKGDLKSPAFLVITNNYDPHWFAWVDGQPAPIYRANLAFQAVFINKTGPFSAVLEYHFPVVWWLHIVSILGVALFIVSAWGPKRDVTSPETLPPAPPRKNLLEDPSVQKPIHKRYRRLGLLGGVAVSLLYAAYLIYVILAARRAPQSGVLAASLGRHIYELAVVPLVGILLSIWIIIVERPWALFSKSSRTERPHPPDDLPGMEA